MTSEPTQTYREIGEDQLAAAIYRATKVEQVVRDLGIYSLTVLIEAVLDEHYPADVFGEGDALELSWMSNQGGLDIDPGVKWVALLRHAIRQVDGATGQGR